MKIIFTFICTLFFLGKNPPLGNIPEKIFPRKGSGNPKTLLWKISGNGMSQPSYLLGINHVVSAEWLNNFPEIKSVIDSADVLMTEFYGDNDKAIFGNSKQADSINRSGVTIRAVDLLTARQYATLDSFFVARFNQELLRLYKNRSSGQTIADLYTDIIRWASR